MMMLSTSAARLFAATTFLASAIGLCQCNGATPYTDGATVAATTEYANFYAIYSKLPTSTQAAAAAQVERLSFSQLYGVLANAAGRDAPIASASALDRRYQTIANYLRSLNADPASISARPKVEQAINLSVMAVIGLAAQGSTQQTANLALTGTSSSAQDTCLPDSIVNKLKDWVNRVQKYPDACGVWNYDYNCYKEGNPPYKPRLAYDYSESGVDIVVPVVKKGDLHHVTVSGTPQDPEEITAWVATGESDGQLDGGVTEANDCVIDSIRTTLANHVASLSSQAVDEMPGSF